MDFAPLLLLPMIRVPCFFMSARQTPDVYCLCLVFGELLWIHAFLFYPFTLECCFSSALHSLLGVPPSSEVRDLFLKCIALLISLCLPPACSKKSSRQLTSVCCLYSPLWHCRPILFHVGLLSSCVACFSTLDHGGFKSVYLFKQYSTLKVSLMLCLKFVPLTRCSRPFLSEFGTPTMTF